MWRILLILLISTFAFAQELPAIFQDYLEQNETLEDDMLTTFYRLLEQPIDLNSCSANELQVLPFVSRQHAQSIVKYRKDKGRFQSVFELQAIRALDTKTIKWLSPFVTVTDRISLTHSDVKHRMRFYLQRFLEVEEEYSRGDYVGSPYKSYFSYSAQSKRMNWGITTEKDGGEKCLDYYAMYFNVKGKNNRLFVGDYQLSLGQGLMHYQGFSFGKSSQVLGTFKNAPVMRSHSSTRENHFLRGLGYQHHYKKWRLSVFLSANKLDANILDSSAIATSIKDVGLHRTASELEDKRQLQHQLIGSRLGFVNRHFKISMYVLAQAYDKSRILGQDTLAQLWGVGWDYSLTFKNTHFFGECVMLHNSMAFLSAFNAQLAPDLSFSLLYRKYPSDYYSYESNAFSEQSNTRNESALYSALSMDFKPNWKVSLYADFYHFPQASYYSDSPLRGSDYFLQLEYQKRKKWRLSAQCKYEIKPNDETDDYGLKTIGNSQQLKCVMHWKYIMGDFNLKSRIAWNALFEEEVGVLMAQELNYKPLQKPWGISLRYLLFDSPSFASRIYAYEPDVMYSFSVPFHYGEGQRLSAVLRYKIKNVTLNAKLAQTLYYDNTEVKSGSVEGNKSTEIKLVLKWVL